VTRRRLFVVGAVAAAVAMGAGGVVWTRDGKGGTPAASASAAGGSAHTATVTRKDLAETQDVGGTLGYGNTTDVSVGAGHGTVTGLAAVGSVVDRGGKLGEVDGLSATLFFGDRPMWRTLDPTATAGADVEQLEANLIALGYGTRGSLGPNQTWSDATTEAVKRWQKAVGRPQTGSVGMGDVVFLPGAVRIAAHNSGGGSGGGGSGLKITGTARVVTVDLDAKYQSLVKAGQPVQVELPDGSRTPATVTSVGSVATAGQNGSSPTIALVVTLNDQKAGPGLDQAPVTVHIVTSQATGVLAVPVGALLALSEGGYAVAKVDRSSGTGTGTRLVAVKLGTFADGWVQVTGSLNEGDKVVTAQ
jgi:hypothetical protein